MLTMVAILLPIERTCAENEVKQCRNLQGENMGRRFVLIYTCLQEQINPAQTQYLQMRIFVSHIERWWWSIIDDNDDNDDDDDDDERINKLALSA